MAAAAGRIAALVAAAARAGNPPRRIRRRRPSGQFQGQVPAAVTLMAALRAASAQPPAIRLPAPAPRIHDSR
jgi:hypothetical protein